MRDTDILRRDNHRLSVVSMDLDTLLTLDTDSPTMTPAHRSHASDFAGTLRRVQPIMRQGWTEGAARASALSSVLAGEIPAATSIRARWEYGPEGEELVAERALAGDWDVAYRRRVRRVQTGHRIVTIAAAFGGTAGITEQQMFWTGAQLAAATDVLEAAGYRVEAHAINISSFGGGDNFGAVDVLCKRPEEPLRPDMIMAVAAYADTFRSYGFVGKCHHPAHFSMWGMGRTLESESEREPILREMEAADLLPTIANWMPHAYSRETAVRNVLAVLHAVTGEGSAHVG